MNIRIVGLLAGFLTLLAIAFLNANAMPDARIFLHLIAVQDIPMAGLMLGILAVGVWSDGRVSWDAPSFERLLIGIDRHRFFVAAALWVALCAGSLVVYRAHPLSMDEYAAVFQARVFAAGAMHGQFPPDLLDNLVPPAFQNYFLMVNRANGAVFSAYWPGFSLLLAPFVWIGAPWACNPTLVACSLLLIARFARDFVDSPLAPGIAMLLALASPAFVVNGISFYAMPAHLLFNLAYAWLLLSATEARIFMAGVLGGFALALHNPFPHAVFAAPWIVWVAFRRSGSWRDLGLLVLGYAVTALPLLVGWSLWQRETLRAASGAVAAMAPTPVNSQPSHLLQDVVSLLASFLKALNWPNESILVMRLEGLSKLWIWAAPMLLILAWLGFQFEKGRVARLLGASAVVTFLAYFLIGFDQGHGWGYRYFHSAWAALPILGAFGVAWLIKRERRPGETILGVLLPCLGSLIFANALCIAQVGEIVGKHLSQFPPLFPEGKQLVVHYGVGYYARDLIQNDPWLRSPTTVLITRTKTPPAELLERHFPGYRLAAENSYGKVYRPAAGAP